MRQWLHDATTGAMGSQAPDDALAAGPPLCSTGLSPSCTAPTRQAPSEAL